MLLVNIFVLSLFQVFTRLDEVKYKMEICQGNNISQFEYAEDIEKYNL